MERWAAMRAGFYPKLYSKKKVKESARMDAGMLNIWGCSALYFSTTTASL
jgi:hypothetical protein